MTIVWYFVAVSVGDFYWGQEDSLGLWTLLRYHSHIRRWCILQGSTGS